jgi:hypothetical protein
MSEYFMNMSEFQRGAVTCPYLYRGKAEEKTWKIIGKWERKFKIK